MSEINYQALREAAEQAMNDNQKYSLDIFHEHVTPPVVLALLDAQHKYHDYANLYEGEKWHYFQLAESEAERADNAEKELQAARQRITELENIATDYALKFQKAQDALKHAILMCNRALPFEEAMKRTKEKHAKIIEKLGEN
ncbi:ead/Ea22-like family protein [Escherichia coli]|uniref:ead/Ea22-like family protein n=1 Tax=Escherichia coli TaxID=562 RepID=UPI00135E7749|nr:ead/Ea22-like family protein [Escherichia coli]MXF04506.1 ead/Ea22-like family protein [Escherichia coli]